ncbi:MAG: hypothetical protein OXB89_01200, partial [Anaerolineaceae bacterium]|nr:hypothetical protein [Anaerolineaceae bacterium]
AVCSSDLLYRPSTALDVLQWPLVGRFLRWRHGRLALQSLLLLAAVLLVVDGLTGPQSAARNLATVAPWVHYRGLVVLILLLAGNLFCMACPFALPRTLGKRFSRGRNFPRVLRNKWLAIATLFTLFLLYEWLDLWASPWLTAWLIITYFVASFLLEVAFRESAFCKYLCPLGSFNFVYATSAPTQIGVKDAETCRHCVGHECVNGSHAATPMLRLDDIPGGQVEVRHGPQGTPGCGTSLFAPQIRSNLDCTLCLDCVRACPHDNIGLMARRPGRELLQPGAWPQRFDVSMLVILLAAMGLTNAFGMVSPVYALQQSLAETFNLRNELIILLLVFGISSLLLPTLLALLAAQLGRLLTGSLRKHNLRSTVSAFAPAFVPVGLGVWIAHYTFHLLLAPFSFIPVLQEFLGRNGDWARFGASLDQTLIGLVQLVAIAGGLVWSLLIAQRAATRMYRRDAVPGMLPWALLLLAIAFIAVWIFSQPMEMRGSILFS